MIQLLSGPFLLLITGRQLACTFLEHHHVWRITETEILPCSTNSSHLSPLQRRDEQKYIALLRSFLSSEHLFYSTTYDLSKSLQNQTTGGRGRADHLLQGGVDLRYIVNRYIAEPFLQILHRRTDTRLEDFLAFCIEGFVEFQHVTVHNRRLTFGLISRRATGRVGTRYHSRGIDDNGNVSNFVETEQILVCDDQLLSFVQVRGSIPLFWRQNINIRYKPPFEFYNSSSMAPVFASHFDDLVRRYGPVAAVNLINQRGWEGELARMFAKQARDYEGKGLHYVPFDFNRQCPRMQWHRVRLLLDELRPDLEAQGYFSGQLLRPQDPARVALAQVLTEQGGVIRTNCIDCLDRTNLVQGFIGRDLLTWQLQKLGVLAERETVNDCAPLEAIFKQVWADNGDAISRQYSGTGALKADFTRTGRRTLMGNLNDGLNSLIRYFLNNFSDGNRQDAMDLFYGHYTVRLENYYSPFIYELDRRLLVAPAILLVSLAVMLYSLWRHGLGKLHLFLLAAFAAVLATYMVLANGIHYVQYPKLRPPPVVAYARPWGPLSVGRQSRKLFSALDPSRKVHVI